LTHLREIYLFICKGRICVGKFHPRALFHMEAY